MNKNPTSVIIAHSQIPTGEQLITLEVDMHRFILSEWNTHRSFSRNAQSSRAVPVLRQLEQIAEDPAMPLWYGKNQAGMSAKEELVGLERDMAEMIILGMRDACLNGVKQLQKLGLHKQTANRYIEPWMWTKGVVTATRTAFEAFFLLRCHKDAQPEIKVLAEAMRDSIDNSTPTFLSYGDYHLPYFGEGYWEGFNNHVSKFGSEEDGSKVTWEVFNNHVSKFGSEEDGSEDVYYDLEDAIKVSASCAGQVSYRVLDDSLEKALKVYGMLNLPENGVYKEDPPHFSPTEHIAKIVDLDNYGLNDILMEEYGTDVLLSISGNFNSNYFWQYRKALEIGAEDLFMKGEY